MRARTPDQPPAAARRLEVRETAVRAPATTAAAAPERRMPPLVPVLAGAVLVLWLLVALVDWL